MSNQTELFNTRCYQKSDFTPIYDPTWDYTEPELEPRKSVREQVNQDTIKSAPERNHWVEEYWVERPTGKHYYYRYCYMIGRKIKHVHIPGGNSRTPLVIYRKLDIEDLISIGESPDKIVATIKKQFK